MCDTDSEDKKVRKKKVGDRDSSNSIHSDS